MNENVQENDIVTLTDEEGNEIELEIIAECERDGERYFAMTPVDDDNNDSEIGEYYILKLEEEDGEDVFVTVEDDEIFDDIADYFDDLFSQEIDYDA